MSILTRYCPWPCNTPDGNQSCQFHDIYFDNMQGKGRSDVQGYFNCSKTTPCYNISLNNVKLDVGDSKASIQCHESAIEFKGDSSPSICTNF